MRALETFAGRAHSRLEDGGTEEFVVRQYPQCALCTATGIAKTFPNSKRNAACCCDERCELVETQGNLRQAQKKEKSMVNAKETKSRGDLFELAKWELKRAIRKPFHLLGFEVSRRNSETDKGATAAELEIWNNPPSTKKHQRILPSATYSPWLSDPEFLETYEKIREFTLVDIYRCYELWSLARQTSDIDGNILEVGVWKGGTGAMLAKAVKEVKPKRVYLADTFAGVVKAGKHDTRYKGGEHSDTSIEVVNALIDSLSLDNTEILQGMFPEDTGSRVHGNISLLHCDVDVYLSSKDIVEWCLPKFTVGSILVFDDFGFSGCEGVTTFCEEFTARRGFRFIHNLNGHAIFIKTAE